MVKYLDSVGLSYFWGKLKALLNGIAGDVSDFTDALSYDNVYIGVGATAAAVMVAANHHDTIYKLSQIAFSNITNGQLWIILPQSYSPSVAMSGLNVPLTQDGTTTVEEVTYKIWKSNNLYTGNFSICMT